MWSTTTTHDKPPSMKGQGPRTTIDPARGQRLVQARERAGFAQLVAAGLMEVTRGTLRRWERGYWISAGALEKLADLYATSLEELRDGAVNASEPAAYLQDWPQWARERWAEVQLELVRDGTDDDTAALDVLRDLRNEIRLLVDHGGLSGDSYRDELQRWYMPLNAHLSIGPPAERIEQFGALMDADVLEVLGPDLRIECSDGRFVAYSGACPDLTVQAATLIEARLPEKPACPEEWFHACFGGDQWHRCFEDRRGIRRMVVDPVHDHRITDTHWIEDLGDRGIHPAGLVVRAGRRGQIDEDNALCRLPGYGSNGGISKNERPAKQGCRQDRMTDLLYRESWNEHFNPSP